MLLFLAYTFVDLWSKFGDMIDQGNKKFIFSEYIDRQPFSGFT